MPRTAVIKTDDFTIKYFRFGTGSRTMVILPGLSVGSVLTSAAAVAKEYEVMKDDFTVYLIDRREDPPAGYTVADMARDTAAAMDALGLSDIYLFGASMGGMISLTLALERPKLVRCLALGSTAARMGGEEYAVLDRWVGLARQKDREGLFLAFGEAIYPPGLFAKYRDAFILLSHTATDEDLQRFIIFAEGAKGFDVLDRLTELRCPVLALGAKDDAVLGGDASALIAGRLGGRPDFAYHRYDGYGHAAFDTAPDYRDRLYRFFMQH